MNKVRNSVRSAALWFFFVLVFALLFVSCGTPSTPSEVSSNSGTEESSDGPSSGGRTDESVPEETDDSSREYETDGSTGGTIGTKSNGLSEIGTSTWPGVPFRRPPSTSSRSTEASSGSSTTAPPVSAATAPMDNCAHWLNPVKSMVNAEANAMWNKIMNAASSTPPSGKTTYYISEKNGNDSNNGTSQATAWKTMSKIGTIPENTNVLFERGGVYRGNFNAKSNCFYGAYGTGAKPHIYGSRENSASANKWVKHSGNIWKLSTSYNDVGIVVINGGRQTGVRKWSMTDLKTNLDFYSEDGGDNTLYLYCDKNPGDAYDSIEAGRDAHIIYIPSNVYGVTIENLTIRYGGAHGIRAADKVKNITVRNCEIGWMGGSLLSPNVPYGNGIEFWNGCENVLVENCWIYQIFDTALTHQGNGTFTVKNLTFQNNLLEYCGFASIEYWANKGAQNQMIDITYSKNIMRFAGYGWERLQRDNGPGQHIHAGGNQDNKATNFKISDNIIELSKSSLCSITSDLSTLPVMSGNTYIQKMGNRLGSYGSAAIATFDDRAHNIIKTRFRDATGTVIFWK